MQTIQRNYRKNPHTARFLQTFHSGISSTGRDYRAEMAEIDLAAAEDLLDLVPEIPAKTDLRSAAQARTMDSIIDQITALDEATGTAARTWTDGMSAAGEWTFGRDPRTGISSWIDRLISKVTELRAAAKTAPAPTTKAPAVADGRYAVEEDGVLKFFRVKNGRRAGFVFLDVQASDDWHSIRNLGRIRSVLALIAADAEEASLRYGRELGVCGDCGRTLTDETSRARGRGPVCDAKH